MDQAHLTHVGHIGRNNWQADCTCGWRADQFTTKRDASSAAWQHWASYPTVTGPDPRGAA